MTSSRTFRWLMPWLISVMMFAGLMLSLPAGAVDNAPPFEDAALQARYENLTHQLRCLVCQNETIADSGATLAGDLRRELREQLAAGNSDEQILTFMTDRYGDFVLYKPPFSARTSLLWLAPALLLVAGLLVVVRIIRQRARMPLEDETVDADTKPDEGRA